MALNFNKYATEGNTFMKAYAKELSLFDDYDQAGRILSTILHGLRSMISTEESLQLIAQLPMFLKAIYVNGWTLKAKEKIKNTDDFIAYLRVISGNTSLIDFYSDEIAEADVHSTFKMLRNYVSSGQMEDVIGQLPKQLKKLFYEYNLE
ncbi:DUF2267 domain-containing protein [uncultured Winogradskyella sp.]|uniref:DUF2267 domain-containing protein n=1 Tax=uncultured Winogradskyella sp. TaxID=395353 RepID=UPI0030D96FA9|tara:strand:- start:1379 stop:1825 length:447 start_codon:yes stop_codon:yes gene_type:complete